MVLGLLAVGLGVGVISGMVGVGGGIFLVPALHYLFKFSQHEAQGTSIAVLVPPIGIFAALAYYRQGYVRLPIVAYIALGFAVGAFAGAVLADRFSGAMLRHFFGVVMFFIATQLLFTGDEPHFRAVLPTAAATGAVTALAWLERRFAIRIALRRRIERWVRRRRPPHRLREDIEYHI
jgi:hypothetical protein